jgi:hypothetical protein
VRYEKPQKGPRPWGWCSGTFDLIVTPASRRPPVIEAMVEAIRRIDQVEGDGRPCRPGLGAGQIAEMGSPNWRKNDVWWHLGRR